MFNQIAQDLGKYTQLVSQDEYKDYSNRELYDIKKNSAFK